MRTYRKTYSQADCFVQELKKQFESFDIYCYIMNDVTKYFDKIEKDSIIIIFNDESFAVNKNITVFPVAMDKQTRNPLEIIADKQSYDVWEQLRCRDLSDDYIPLVACCFARKIIAIIMPTFYSESGLIFISHRRLVFSLRSVKFFGMSLLLQLAKKLKKKLIKQWLKVMYLFLFIHLCQQNLNGYKKN